MRLKVFIATTLAVFTALTLPAAAQGEPPTGSTTAPNGGTPNEPPAAPPGEVPPPPETAPKDAPPTPPAGPARSDAAPAAAPASDQEDARTGESFTDEDLGSRRKIGEPLSPLVLTAGLGYAYAAVNHPELVSHNLSGAFLEITVGTELDPRFRLALSFTSFETKLRRTHGGKWEEGEYTNKISSGLHSQADPVEPTAPMQGGVEVQKTFHAHSLGPRMDFLPLGSQGPYLGLTVAAGVIQDVSTRVGLDLGARVGGEWRPFHSLGLAIEAGAHGQLYEGANVAIPYALARMSLMLEPSNMKSKGSSSPSINPMTMPRTLPAPPPR